MSPLASKDLNGKIILFILGCFGAITGGAWALFLHELSWVEKAIVETKSTVTSQMSEFKTEINTLNLRLLDLTVELAKVSAYNSRQEAKPSGG